jgi:hypothetical protein
LAELKKWLEEQRPQALPKSPLGQAVGHARRYNAMRSPSNE